MRPRKSAGVKRSAIDDQSAFAAAITRRAAQVKAARGTKQFTKFRFGADGHPAEVYQFPLNRVRMRSARGGNLDRERG